MIRTGSVGLIAAADPDLGRHLRNSIRTDVLCAYHPESALDWTVLDSDS